MPYSEFYFIPSHFRMVFHCFKSITQLLDSDWPANILAGSHFRAQETRALSPDGVCALARARLGMRLVHDLIEHRIKFFCYKKKKKLYELERRYLT